MTKGERAALEWFARQPGPVGWFDASAPSQTMRKKLAAKSWIMDRMPPGGVGLVKVEITGFGRKALEDSAT